MPPNHTSAARWGRACWWVFDANLRYENHESYSTYQKIFTTSSKVTQQFVLHFFVSILYFWPSVNTLLKINIPCMIIKHSSKFYLYHSYSTIIQPQQLIVSLLTCGKDHLTALTFLLSLLLYAGRGVILCHIQQCWVFPVSLLVNSHSLFHLQIFH